MFEEFFFKLQVVFVLEHHLFYGDHLVCLHVVALVDLSKASRAKQLQGLVPVVNDGPVLSAVL